MVWFHSYSWGACTSSPATVPSSFMRKWLPSFHNSPQNLSLKCNKHKWQSISQYQRCSQTDHRDQYLGDDDCISRLPFTMTRLWSKRAVIRHVQKSRLKIISSTCRSKIRIWGIVSKVVKKCMWLRKIDYMSKLVVLSPRQCDWGLCPPQTLALASFFPAGSTSVSGHLSSITGEVGPRHWINPMSAQKVNLNCIT